MLDLIGQQEQQNQRILEGLRKLVAPRVAGERVIKVSAGGKDEGGGVRTEGVGGHKRGSSKTTGAVRGQGYRPGHPSGHHGDDVPRQPDTI